MQFGTTHALISQNFESKFRQFPHSRKFTLALFWQNFREATFLLKKLLNSWFDEIFSVRENFSFFYTVSSIICTVWKNKKFSLTEKISSNQLFSNFVTKTIAFTKFLQKSVRDNFCNFHTECAVDWNLEIDFWPHPKDLFMYIYFQFHENIENRVLGIK